MSEVPSPYPARGRRRAADRRRRAGSGSIIVVVATDAPLLPHQCDRLAQRAGLGDRPDGRHRAPTRAATCSCASRPATGRCRRRRSRADPRLVVDVRAVNDHAIGGLFDGVIEATEEAILNALVAAKTMTGRDGDHRASPCPTTGCSRRWPGSAGRHGWRTPGARPWRSATGRDPAGGRGRPRRRFGRSSRRTATTARSSSPTSSGRTSGTSCGSGAPGSRSRTARSSGSGRRSTPADRSTSRTCSSGRTGWARASAGRCSRTRSATPSGGRRSPPTTRAALPIYVRAGMRPWWPNLYVEGTADRLPAPPAAISTRDATADELAETERTWSGHDRIGRPGGHWTEQPAADNFVVLDGGAGRRDRERPRPAGKPAPRPEPARRPPRRRRRPGAGDARGASAEPVGAARSWRRSRARARCSGRCSTSASGSPTAISSWRPSRTCSIRPGSIPNPGML